MQFNLKLSSTIGLGAAILQVVNSQVTQRPNIIYIMSDDHAWQAISAYGGPLKDLAATSKTTIADQARLLKSLQNMIQSQKDIMSNLKNSSF